MPAGALTGNIVVCVSSQPSNGWAFTVLLPGTFSGSVTRVTGGTGIGGASVQVLQTEIVKGTTTTASDGSYSMAALLPGTYDVRVLATGFSAELRSSQTITSSTTTTLNVSMYAPGSVGGRVTQADGVTPLSGAAVSIYSGPAQKGTTNTNGTGDYTIGGLHPGSFTVQASDVGYTTKEQGAAVTESATTTSNFLLQGAPAGPVLYAYDELDRLIQVTDPAGESAIYRYDKVGNITAIERPGAGGVKISGFTPREGVSGTAVTIFGTGFSTTPAQDGVMFGAAPAAVTSATATQLVTTVPAGLSTGSYTVGVTSPGGSATGDAFVVTGANAAPAISGFSPAIAAVGTTLTVNGTNFDPIPSNNSLRLNIVQATVTASTSTTLSTSVPLTGSGRLSLATPGGQAVSSQDVFVPFGTHVAGDVGFTGRIAFGGTQTVPLNTNQIGLVLFDATAGQRVSVQLSGSTFTSCTLYVLGPYAQQLASTGCTSATTFLDSVTLAMSATYTIAVDAGASSGSVAVTLNEVPDVTGLITIDGLTVPVPTTAGQDGRLTFSGTAGQRITVRVTDITNPAGWVNLVRPDGSTQAGTFFCCGSAFIDTQVLPTTGTYTLWVQHSQTGFGSVTLQLSSVAADMTGSITIDGPTVPVPTTTPGQDGRVTFSATAGQQITVA